MINQKNTITTAILMGFVMIIAVAWVQKPVVETGTVALNRMYDPHIYGDKNAQTTIVEFSDVECPFCARLHPTLEQIVDQSDGTINWEYRHLPLPNHRNAELGAVATECVAAIAGNDYFWQFLDEILREQKLHSEDYYVKVASNLGVDQIKFRECLSSSEYDDVIEKDVQAAHAFGGRGTPYSVIKFPDGTTKSVPGALPFSHWQDLLKQ